MRSPSPLVVIKFLIAVAFVSGLGLWASQHVSWAALRDAWQHVQGASLLLILTGIFLSHFLRVLRLFHAYRVQSAVNLLRVAGVSLVHNTVSFMLPMRLGEAALPILSRQHLQVDMVYSVSTLLLLRLFDAHWLFLLLVFFAADTFFEADRTVLLLASLATLPLGILAARTLVFRVPRLQTARPLVERLSTVLALYVETGAIWVIKLAALSLLAAQLGSLTVDHAWIATIMADASALSPLTGFANAGTFELAFSLPLLPLGYAQSALLTVALNLHMVVLVTNIAVGVVGAAMMFFQPNNPKVH